MLANSTDSATRDDGSRKDSEREFHNQRYGGEVDPRGALGKWYAAVDSAFRQQIELIRRAPADAKILEYGCADGRLSLLEQQVAQRFTKFCGIDISDRAIERARETAASLGLQGRRFEVMDAEAMTFPDREFDLVYGRGILHHLDLNRCFGEIARVLRPGGTAVFVEPMGHNPALNWYRSRTPELRTPDEHPLLMADFRLAKRFFSQIDLTFVGLSTLLAVPLLKTQVGRPAMTLCETVDRYLLRVPGLQRNAWFVLMQLTR
jgi:SAM-dependent methyltransferase